MSGDHLLLLLLLLGLLAEDAQALLGRGCAGKDAAEGGRGGLPQDPPGHGPECGSGLLAKR